MIANPKALFLLFLLLPIAWVSYRRYRRSAPGVLAIAGGEARETANLFLVRWFFSSLSFLLALAFGVLAISGVSWGHSPPEERPASVEVVFLFDISRSMLAQDIRPSRLERSVAVARSVVDEKAGGSFGISLFKGQGLVFLPLTTDFAAISSYLDTIDYRLMSAPGTNLQSGLEAAISAFPGVRDTRRCIVVFTDGDFLAGDPREVVRKMAFEKIELAVVAVGRETPVTIPFAGDVVRDDRGEPVRTALRPDVVGAISAEADGIALRIEADDVVSRIEEFIGGRGPIAKGRPVDRFRTMIGFALGFLLLWLTLRTVRWGGAF